MVEAELLEALRPGRATVRIGVDDQLGARAKRGVARRVHVAQDHVRLAARLEERVRPAVNADQHRLDVADVRRAAPAGPCGRCVPAHHDQRVAVAEPRPRPAGSRSRPARSAPSSRRWAIVFSAKSMRASSIRARCSASCSASSATLKDAARRQHRPVASNLAAGDRDEVTVPQLLEERRGGCVDQPDAGLARASAARRSGSGRSSEGATFTTAGTRRGHEVLSGDPIEVRVVDDRDVRRTQAADEHLRLPPEPGAPLDRHLRPSRAGPRAPGTGHGCVCERTSPWW